MSTFKEIDWESLDVSLDKAVESTDSYFKLVAEPPFPSTQNPFRATSFRFFKSTPSSYSVVCGRKNMQMTEQVAFILSPDLDNGSYDLVDHDRISVVPVIDGAFAKLVSGTAKVSWDRAAKVIDLTFEFTTNTGYKVTEGTAHVHETA